MNNIKYSLLPSEEGRVRYWPFIHLLILLSCGQASRALPGGRMVGVKAESRSFVSRDLSLAQDICYALRSKNIRFRTSFLGRPFAFRVATKDCDGVEADQQISSILRMPSSRGPLIYESEGGEDSYTVQTHKAGFLRYFCAYVLEGNPLGNTYIDGERGEKVQYVLHRKETASFDGISLVYFKDEESPSHREVRLSMNLDGRLLETYGLIHRIEVFEACSQEGVLSSFVREYLPRPAD